MSETDATGEGGDDAGAGAAGVDRRQVALVVLCLLGLVVAAFVAPILPNAGVGGDSPGDGAGGQSGDGDGEASNGDGSGEMTARDGGSGSERGSRDGEGSGGGNRDGEGDRGEGDVIRDDGDPIPVPGGDAPPIERGCAVVVEDEPIPGAMVEVSVYDDLRPAPNVSVWFGDRFVGHTDEEGSVQGRAPYTREVNVTVRKPDEDCQFFRREYGEDSQSEVAGPERSALSGPNRAGLGDPRGDRDSSLGDAGITALVQASDENDTAPYAVHGTANVTVIGDPYPGETVTVSASVEDVGMRYANVSVDGERVGRTAADGTYDLALPTDEDSVRVVVERGEFGGATTIDVWLLETNVVPQEGLPFPGEPALVNASVADSPADGARVSLDGSRLGRTDDDGSVGFSLPADPRQSVTVRTERQTATTTVWNAYLATVVPAAFLLVAGVVGVSVTTHVRGRRAGRRAALLWGAVATVFVGLVVGEGFGLLVSTGVVLLGTAVLNRGTVRSGGESAAGSLADLVAFVRRTALAIADWVAVALDRAAAALGRIAARIASLPLSVRGLAARLGAWLRALPRRVGAYAAVRLSVRRIVVAAVALALVAGLTTQFGALGFLGSLVALFVAFLVYRWWTREETDASSDDDRPTFGSADARSNGDDGPTRRSLRVIWRQFARWVRPNSWRQSTPGEVSRAAIERGFPERPVRVLTEAFREVEYGDRSSTDRSERAREAFESIEREREGEDS